MMTLWGICADHGVVFGFGRPDDGFVRCGCCGCMVPVTRRES